MRARQRGMKFLALEKSRCRVVLVFEWEVGIRIVRVKTEPGNIVFLNSNEFCGSFRGAVVIELLLEVLELSRKTSDLA